MHWLFPKMQYGSVSQVTRRTTSHEYLLFLLLWSGHGLFLAAIVCPPAFHFPLFPLFLLLQSHLCWLPVTTHHMCIYANTSMHLPPAHLYELLIVYSMMSSARVAGAQAVICVKWNECLASHRPAPRLSSVNDHLYWFRAICHRGADAKGGGAEQGWRIWTGNQEKVPLSLKASSVTEGDPLSSFKCFDSLRFFFFFLFLLLISVSLC